jgi:hypothetical protein
MTECYSARCQQDRKTARREFNKWTKNLLLQIGLETIAKNHLDFDANLFNQIENFNDDIPVDFNPNEVCLFCHNRQEYLGNKKSIPHIINNNDDDENAPLDLSLKSTPIKSPLITSTNRTNVKFVFIHFILQSKYFRFIFRPQPFFDIKSDIPPMYGQQEFDRFMSDMIASQLGK